MTQRVPKIDQLPAVGLLGEIQALIDARIDLRFKTAEQLGASMTPLGLRLASGMSQDDVAARSGGKVSALTVSHIETGKTRSPMGETMNTIATAIGCTPKEYRVAVARLVSAIELARAGRESGAFVKQGKGLS